MVPPVAIPLAFTAGIILEGGGAFKWNNPTTDINSGNFGRITGASGARTFTLNARIDF